MPELPEVETTLRGIEPHTVGRRVRQMQVRQWQLRWPIPPDLPELLTNKKILGLARRGKYLLARFSHGHMILHLGMSGSLRLVDPSQAPGKHDHIDWRLGGGQVLRYCDPRRFGAALWTSEPIQQHPLLEHLGPEPLTEEFSGEYLFLRSRRRQQPIKSFIMDARQVVGVGNIYANEALFLAGVRPRKRAGLLTRAHCNALVAAIKQVLGQAISAGGTTLRDFVGSDGQPGYFKQELFVYGRDGEGCRRCGAGLKLLRLGQRATVYCPKCQA